MPESRARAVVFIANGLGDHLMMIPVVRAFGRIFKGRLVIAALPVARTIFCDVQHERFVPLQLAPQRGPRAVDVQAAAAQIGAADVLVSLNRTSDGDAVQLGEGIKASVTAGLFPEFRAHVPFDQSAHCTDLAFRLVRRFDSTLELEHFSQPPSLGKDATNAGADFARLLPPGTRLLIVHADTSPEKQWSSRRFQRLLDRFLAKRPDFVALVLGARDIGLRGGSTRRVFSALGLPLGVSLALLALGAGFVGVDSALLHAADLFRLPSAALFGPGDPRQFGCRFCAHEHVTAPSLADIREDAVLLALDRLLAR